MHAITFDTPGGKTDILPSARYGRATCINNRGEIAGYAYGGPGPIQTGFRRSTDGEFTTFDPVPPGYVPQPLWINAQGVVIGMSVPGGWASPAGSSVVPLPRLFGMPLATVTDINDAGWIVGTSESWDHTEHYATLWEPRPDGTWTARDLTDLLTTPGILLYRAIAINNDGKIIVAGQLDNGDTAPSGLYLLTPSSTASTSCVPDIGRQPLSASSCGTTVSFNVQLANPNASTTYQWSLDGTPITAGSNPSALTPALVIPVVSEADAGTYECTVTNTCGSTTSNAATLTVLSPSDPACCPCSADFDTSGGTPDANDIDAFFTAWLVGAPMADADCSGGTPDVNDIDSFFSQWLNGGC